MNSPRTVRKPESSGGYGSGWLIGWRAEHRIPTTNNTPAELVVYNNILLAGTSLYIKDEVGYICLGQTHRVLRLKPNEDLQTVSFTRQLGDIEDRILIKDEYRGYEWNIEESKLSPYA